MKRETGMSWVLALALAAVGFCVGAILGGGWLPRVFDWETEWLIDAPLALVYKVLSQPEEQAKWWPSMKVVGVTPLPGVPDGRRIEYQVRQAQSVARLVPPFKIVGLTADIEPERRLRTVVTGDLVGVLETLLYARPEGSTRIVYHWYVRVHNPLLNAVGIFGAPMYRASHDHVMKEGEVGLARYCAQKLEEPLWEQTTH